MSSLTVSDYKQILDKHRERWVRDQLTLMECRDMAVAEDDETLLHAISRLKLHLDFANECRATGKAESDRLREEMMKLWNRSCADEKGRAVDVGFSAYKIPIGTEFVLGKRRWCLVERMELHPDFLTFREVSQSPHTPDRIFNPSEIDALHALGVVFQPGGTRCDDCGEPKPRGVCDRCHPVVEA